MKHNSYILSGYRVHLTMGQMVASFFHIHNETLNCWSHLLGIIWFGVLLFNALNSWLANGTFTDKALVSVYVLSAQILFACSTCFHGFHCKSAHWYTTLARCDYTGIAVLIAGSYYCPVYYLFHCQPYAVAFYWTGITVVGGMAVYVSYTPSFEKPGYEMLRAGVFVAMGFFAVLMAPHALYLYGTHTLWPMAVRGVGMGLVYLVGVVFYIVQFPERFFPGYFDCSFHSHVIWHCFVLAGAYGQLWVCQYLFEQKDALLHACLAR